MTTLSLDLLKNVTCARMQKLKTLDKVVNDFVIPESRVLYFDGLRIERFLVIKDKESMEISFFPSDKTKAIRTKQVVENEIQLEASYVEVLKTQVLFTTV